MIRYTYIYFHTYYEEIGNADIFVACTNDMSHMSKKHQIEVVTILERIFINLSNGAKTMDLAHAQPKLLDTEHARGRKLQTEKIAFHVSVFSRNQDC